MQKFKIKLPQCCLIIFLLCMIGFVNGTNISKALKVLFVFLSGLAFFFNGVPKTKFYHIRWMIAVLFLDCISYSWAYSKETAISGIKTVGLNTICVFLVVLILSAEKKLLKDVFIGISILPIFRFILVFGSYGFEIFHGLRNINGYRDYNTMGMFAAFGAVFSYSYYKYILKNKSLLIVMVINILIILLSLSRKGILYFIIPVLIVSLIEKNSLSKRMQKLIWIVLFSIIVYELIMNIPILYNFVGNGLENIINYFVTGKGDSSAAARNDRIEYGLKMYSEKPWFGYGIQNYNYFFERSGHISENMTVADNNYIDVLFNTGFVGLVLYYSTFVVASIKYIKNKRKSLLNKLGFSILLTLAVCDYGVSAYLYLHSQFFLALAVMLICFDFEASFDKIHQVNEGV